LREQGIKLDLEWCLLDRYLSVRGLTFPSDPISEIYRLSTIVAEVHQQIIHSI